MNENSRHYSIALKELNLALESPKLAATDATMLKIYYKVLAKTVACLLTPFPQKCRHTMMAGGVPLLMVLRVVGYLTPYTNSTYIRACTSAHLGSSRCHLMLGSSSPDLKKKAKFRRVFKGGQTV
jgi:hypothetical protein